MNQSNFLSILRFILTAVGAYLVGKNFLGTPLDNNLIEGIVGAVISLASIIWGIVDKSATVEQVQSGLRSVIAFFGPMLVGAGLIKDQVVESLTGIVLLVVPMIYSQTSRKKSNDVANDKLPVENLAGVQSSSPTDPQH